MKRFAAPILILLAVVCIVALGNWRSARRELQTTTNDLLTTSNKLTETTAQLVTKAAAFETLRITQNLRAADLSALSNRLDLLATELDRANQANRQTGETLRQRESELAGMRAEIGKWQQTTEELRAETQNLRGQQTTAEVKIKVEQQHGERLNDTVNELQAETAVFHQQWNDPASLRAQLAKANKAVAINTRGRNPADSAKLALQPDGSVTTVPIVSEEVPAPKR